MGKVSWQSTYLFSVFAAGLRFAIPFFLIPLPLAFLRTGSLVAFFRGVGGAEPFFPVLDTVKFALEVDRILTRRSEIARGVGASK